MRGRVPLRHRALARIFNAMGWVANGYTAPFTSELLRSYGVRGMVERTSAIAELAALVEAELGERDGHLLLGFASLWNGCAVCSLGHVYAGNLAHFRDHGALLPLEERDLHRRMLRDTDDELFEHIEGCFQAPSDARLLGLTRRLYTIKRSGEDDGVDERPGDTEMLTAVISAYDWMNLCTIYGEGDDPPLIAFSRLNRSFGLRSRYARARATAAKGP
jgi:hypothetical protein